MEKHVQKFTDCNGSTRQVAWWRLRGNKPGPVLTLIAGQHGMEHVGPGFLPEFAEEMDKTEFAGELRICANANPFALALDYEFYPEHEDLTRINEYFYSIFRHSYCPWNLGRSTAHSYYNMNRTWNSREAEGVAKEISAWLWKDMISGSDIVIDMHCHQGKPLMFETEALYDPVFSAMPGIPVLCIKKEPDNEWQAGTLTCQTQRNGIKSICYEFSVQHARGEFEFEEGKQCVRNLMKGCRMLEGAIVHDHPVWKLPREENKGLLYAEHEGRLRFFKERNDFVRKGELVFTIRSVETGEIVQEGRAAMDGIVWSPSFYTIVKPGFCCVDIHRAELILPAGKEAEKFPENWWLKKGEK